MFVCLRAFSGAWEEEEVEGEEEEMEEEGAEVPALAASCLQHWGSAFWAVPAFRQHRRSGAPSRFLSALRDPPRSGAF